MLKNRTLRKPSGNSSGFGELLLAVQSVATIWNVQKQHERHMEKKLGGCTTVMGNNHGINYLLVLALQVYDSTIFWTVNFQLFTSQSTHQSPQPWRVLPWLGWSYLPTAPGLLGWWNWIKKRPQNAGNLKKMMVIFVLSQGTSSFRHNSQISSEELWQGVVLFMFS